MADRDPHLPSDPGVERAREAAPSPARTRPEVPADAPRTASDAAGERARDEHPPERPGPATPAPPRAAGPDVNDVDRLEEGVDRHLGAPPPDVPPRR
jgi:hypothetical protein